MINGTLDKPNLLFTLEQLEKIECNDADACQALVKQALQRGEEFIESLLSRNSYIQSQSHLIQPLESQVGGFGSCKKLVLKLTIAAHHDKSSSFNDEVFFKNSFILKPVRDDHRGFREIAFYEASLVDPNITIFKDFIPCYHGVLNERTLKTVQQLQYVDCTINGNYILIEEVTAPFRIPNVLDVKMGRQTFEPGEALAKIQYEASKYPNQHHVGFRIVGMRIHTLLEDILYVKTFDKIYGRSLTTERHLIEAFKLFFSCPTKDQLNECTDNYNAVNIAALDSVLTQLNQLKRCFEMNNSYAFYASSILIAYGACVDNQNRKETKTSVAVVKMIDFGRVQRSDGGDQGYLHGITTLCNIIKTLTDGA